MNIRLSALAVAAVVGFTATPGASKNLVKNGSFETPEVPVGSYQTFNTGDSFKGWSVVGQAGNIAIVQQDFSYCTHTFPAKRGAQFVDLTGTSDSATGLQQMVKTTPGSTYSLSFYIGNVYDASSNCGVTSTVNVEIDGVTVASFTNKKGKGSTEIAWQKFSTEFVAQNPATMIALVNGDPPEDTANGLDAISVALVQ